MELLSSATRGVRFTAAHALLDVTPVDAAGPDGVEIDIPLMAYQNTTDPALLATALSSVATLTTL